VHGDTFEGRGDASGRDRVERLAKAAARVGGKPSRLREGLVSVGIDPDDPANEAVIRRATEILLCGV